MGERCFHIGWICICLCQIIQTIARYLRKWCKKLGSNCSNDIGYSQICDDEETERVESLNRDLASLQEQLRFEITEKNDALLRVEMLNEKLQASEKAREEALNRLSEIVGLKISDNNPNIADLSDINRPTNLVEKFSLLYDDEWTETFNVLAKKPEFGEDSKAIDCLLEIVKECFRVCRDESSKQLQQLLAAYNTTFEVVPKEMVKLTKDTIKKHAALCVPTLLQKMLSVLNAPYGEIIRDKTILAYVERCTALCWLMAVQDPPMTLLSDVSPDRLFDKTKYREYTKSGKYVEFIVWPCVLLQDGGSLMSKGIAQGQDQKRDNNPF